MKRAVHLNRPFLLDDGESTIMDGGGGAVAEGLMAHILVRHPLR